MERVEIEVYGCVCVGLQLRTTIAVCRSFLVQTGGAFQLRGDAMMKQTVMIIPTNTAVVSKAPPVILHNFPSASEPLQSRLCNWIIFVYLCVDNSQLWIDFD